MQNKLDNIQRSLQDFSMLRAIEVKQGVITREECESYELGMQDVFSLLKNLTKNSQLFFNKDTIKEIQRNIQSLKNERMNLALNGEITKEELDQYQQGLKISYLTFKEKFENRQSKLDKFSL